MTAFDVYLISTAGSLSEFFGIAVGISFVCFIACLITMPMLLDFFDVELNKFPFKKILLLVRAVMDFMCLFGHSYSQYKNSGCHVRHILCYPDRRGKKMCRLNWLSLLGNLWLIIWRKNEAYPSF